MPQRKVIGFAGPRGQRQSDQPGPGWRQAGSFSVQGYELCLAKRIQQIFELVFSQDCNKFFLSGLGVFEVAGYKSGKIKLPVKLEQKVIVGLG